MSLIPLVSLFALQTCTGSWCFVRAVRQSNWVAGPNLSLISRRPVKRRKLRDAKLRDRLRSKDDAREAGGIEDKSGYGEGSTRPG